jgi:Domain of unknown function (DUF4432)
MINLWSKTYTKTDLLRRVGDISQLASAQVFELVDGNERGSRAVLLRNAVGLEAMVVTERGMALTHVSFQGVPLAFISPTGSVHPSYYEPRGLGWLRTFPGGFLTPCGLTQVGSPAEENGEELGQHGRVAHIPARNVSFGGKWEGDHYIVWVKGNMHETRFFGENLVLTRVVSMKLDEPRLWIEDRVENCGFDPAPHMFLQHFNLGFPLVDAATRLVLPEHVTTPRDAEAQAGMEHYTEFNEPVSGYREQVFFHDLQPDADGMVTVKLVNPAFDQGRGVGVAFHYRREEYPILVQWKMMGNGLYVVGIEPANCHVSGRTRERELGTLQILAPQEVRTYNIEVEFTLGG